MTRQTPDSSTRVLILGATGMLGHAAFRLLSAADGVTAFGTVRSAAGKSHFAPEIASRLIDGVDADNLDSVLRAFAEARPQVVINCIGVIKHLAAAHDPLTVLPLNALFPHRLAQICTAVGAKLVHISTDCVFDGTKGCYAEADTPDARDLYGVSKALGEVTTGGHLTLRTSIIGPELHGKTSLLEWFLAQTGTVPGYGKAIFSGLPTIVLAQVIRDHVLTNPDLAGLYHVSAAPIDKLSLLRLVAETYGTGATLQASDAVVIDRSLNSDRFRAATGFNPPAWPALIAQMHRDHQLRLSRPKA
ncbi:dTDP-4-dehydrorhamnose reductase family protein [Paracoccus sp. p3-h83]|uniref:dTDP-4-dehydrorhamnose reductase family protein n=1 Tax=Paracoccus sp. p3-h83 TaxID=3342805 RepID=UPI0035B9ABF5